MAIFWVFLTENKDPTIIYNKNLNDITLIRAKQGTSS